MITDEQLAWVREVAVRYDGALGFLWVGAFGSHYSLLPGLLWRTQVWVH